MFSVEVSQYISHIHTKATEALSPSQTAAAAVTVVLNTDQVKEREYTDYPPTQQQPAPQRSTCRASTLSLEYTANLSEKMEGVNKLLRQGITYIDKSKEFLDRKGKDYLDKLEETLDREKLQSYMHVVLNKGVFPGAEHYPDGTVRIDNVRLIDRFSSRKPIVGTLYLTATHLIFVDPGGQKETWVLHMHMSAIDKLPLTTSGSPMQIRCKNFMNVTFVIPRDRDCQDIYMSLLTLSQPVQIDDLYAFHHTAPDIPSKLEGWDFFDMQSEYQRMGVPGSKWVLTNINHEYDLCDTYSRYLYVPASASTPVIMGSAKFRSKSRLPALSYLHKENQAAICRCSQPLAGFSARCVEDEQMLQAIRKANPNSKFMFVVDTRPKINAMANRAAGKGYENENFYSNIKFQFWGIENIHVMRNSLQKLQEVCELKNPSMSAFLSGLESSGWLKHIKSVLDTSAFIAKAIKEGISVLVHCSDGWDRTAQTCGLASLLLDPYYRTIHGYQNLIEKEWLSFGHKFTDRCGLLGTVDPKEMSPIFTQFIDSTWQLMQQFPTAFQFNERYLLTLHDHVYSCQFGTFIGNCEKDRLDLRLKERTYSLWGYLTKYTSDFMNPFYKKELELSTPVLIPVTHPQVIKFWKGLYCRFDSGIHPREGIVDTVCALRDHTCSIEDHRKLLDKKLSSLSKLLGRGEDNLRRAFQNLSSSDSMDFRSLLLTEPTATTTTIANPTASPQPTNNHHHHRIEVPTNSHSYLCPELDPLAPTAANNPQQQLPRKESDSESGFEDGSSSQMSRSLLDERDVNCGLGVLSECDSLESLQVEQVLTELQSVSVDWKSYRTAKNCSCAMPFEHHVKKYHCWRCGEVFCTRCIDRQVTLPGHDSKRPVPVCKSCVKDMKNSPSPSIDDFQKLQKQLVKESSSSPSTGGKNLLLA